MPGQCLVGRRGFLQTLGIGAAGCVLPCRGAVGLSALAGRRPNIVLVLTDDQGYGDLGRHGNPVIRTPHLDAMYDRSVRFADFHVSPTCAPTRCSIMTGRHEFRSGVTHTIHERERMSLAAITVAQVLKQAGYRTGIFGKWHLGDEDAYQPGRRGFDEVFIHGAGGIGQTFSGSCGDVPRNGYFDPVIRHNGRFVKTRGYCTDVFFRQACSWIEAVRSDGPFFAVITPNAPHAPLICPDPEFALYRETVPNEKTAKFLGMVTNIDTNVGSLFETLRTSGIEKDTLVVYMNDNGGTAGCGVFNAGMKGAKGSANNGGTRAMSLWHWPAALAPASIDALTAHIDLFPTFAELAGASLPAEAKRQIEGFSLLPLLQDPAAPWHDQRALVTHVGRWKPGTPPEKFGRCSVRRRQYLLVRSNTGWSLHDLKADPGEKTDLAPTHPDIVADLAATYDDWWNETLPQLDNEEAFRNAPALNPFKEAYWRQYGGPGPNEAPPPPAFQRAPTQD
ncbi:MAG: arylsulfatase [Lentisphaeria bacterium]|nr:arylsulfatase [Lentisphaeria bacterium]